MAKKTNQNDTTKIIDLTENKTSMEVQKMITAIRRFLEENSKKTNIPVIMTIFKNPSIVGDYFLNRKFYTHILGSNIKLMDQIFTNTVGTIVSESIEGAIHDKKVNIPGYWTRENIYAIVMSTLTIWDIDGESYMCNHPAVRKIDHKMINETILKMCDSQDATVMKFSDYNPNRFYQFYMRLSSRVISIILSELYCDISANMVRAGETLAYRRAKEFATIYNKNLEVIAETTPIDFTTGTPDEIMTRFVSAIISPLSGYISALLQVSGFSPEVLREMNASSEAHAYYDFGRKLEDVTPDSAISEKTTISYTVVMKGHESTMATFNASAADIYAMYGWVDDKTTPNKNAINRLGKALSVYLQNMICYTINVAIVNSQSNILPPTADDVEVESAE